MDYEFTYDDYGQPVIRLEMGQEAMAQWLNGTVVRDKNQLAALLSLLENLRSGREREALLTDKGFEVQLTSEEVDVVIVSNDVLNEEYRDEGLTLYEDEQSSGCGLEDLLDLLRDWQDFIQS